MIRRSLAALFLFAVAIVFLNPGCFLEHRAASGITTAESDRPVTHVTLRPAFRENLAPGHVLFASIATSHETAPFDIVPPDGWTRIDQQAGIGQETAVRLATFFKIAGNSEPQDYVFKLGMTGSGGGQEPSAFMTGILVSVYRRGQLDSSRGGVGTTTQALPSTGAPRVVGAIFARDRAGDYSAPAGWTQRVVVKGGSAQRGHTQYGLMRNGIDAREAPPVTVINNTPAPVTVWQVVAFRQPR